VPEPGPPIRPAWRGNVRRAGNREASGGSPRGTPPGSVRPLVAPVVARA